MCVCVLLASINISIAGNKQLIHTYRASESVYAKSRAICGVGFSSLSAPFALWHTHTHTKLLLLMCADQVSEKSVEKCVSLHDWHLKGFRVLPKLLQTNAKHEKKSSSAEWSARMCAKALSSLVAPNRFRHINSHLGIPLGVCLFATASTRRWMPSRKVCSFVFVTHNTGDYWPWRWTHTHESNEMRSDKTDELRTTTTAMDHLADVSQ